MQSLRLGRIVLELLRALELVPKSKSPDSRSGLPNIWHRTLFADANDSAASRSVKYRVESRSGGRRAPELVLLGTSGAGTTDLESPCYFSHLFCFVGFW